MPQFPDNLEPLLAGYVDGTLSKDELAQVEVYLDQQPELRDELQRMMLDSEYLRMLPQARLPQDVSDTVGSQLEREMLLSDAGAPTRAAQQRFGLPGLAVAAMVLVGAGIGVLAFQILGSERQSLPALAAREAAAPQETSPTTGRVAEESFADASPRVRDFGPPSPAPAIVSAAPVALDALPVAIEDEVVARIDLSEVADRPIVMVVESADLGVADRQVRGFLMDNGYAYLSSDDAHFPADALARGLRRATDITASNGGASAAPGAVTSNALPPNAVGNAIELKRADHQSTILLARHVDPKLVHQLQSQLNGAVASAGIGSDRDAIARARDLQNQQRAALYRANAGELKLKQFASMQKAQQPAGAGEDPSKSPGVAIAANVPDAAAPATPSEPTTTPPAASVPSASVAATPPAGADAGAAAAVPPAERPTVRLVQPGDALSITLRADAQMQTNASPAVQVTVDADGFIDVPDRGVYQVRGLTAQQVAATLAGVTDPATPPLFSVVIHDPRAEAHAEAAKPEAAKSDAPTTAPTTVPAIDGPTTVPAVMLEAGAAQGMDRVDLIIVVRPIVPVAASIAPTTVPVK